MVGIYKIQNIISGKLYIGSSYNIRERLINHKSMLRCNKHHSIHLQNAYNKYGIKNFIFEIIEECKIENLLEREQYYLNKLLKADLYIKNESNYFIKNGYNILPKSISGFTKKHKRESIIKSQRTRGFSSIYKINYKGKILKEYDLISDINLKSSRVYKSIKTGNCIKSENYGFIYSKDYTKNFKPKKLISWNTNKKYKQINFKSYPVYIYDIYGRFIIKYDNFRDCCINMKIPPPNLHRDLNNKKFRNRKYLYFTEKQNFNNLIYFEKDKENNTTEIFTIFNESLGYSTPIKISKILKANLSSIYQVINNKAFQCKGYKFQTL